MCIFTIDTFFCSVLCVCCATNWCFFCVVLPSKCRPTVLTSMARTHIRLVAKPRMTNFNPNSVTLMHATFLKACWTTSDQYGLLLHLISYFVNLSCDVIGLCNVHCSNAHDNQSVNCAVSFFFGHKNSVGPQAGICQGLLTHYDEVGVAASPDWGVEAREHGTGDGGTQQECLAFAIISKYSAFGAMKSIKAEHFTA